MDTKLTFVVDRLCHTFGVEKKFAEEAVQVQKDRICAFCYPTDTRAAPSSLVWLFQPNQSTSSQNFDGTKDGKSNTEYTYCMGNLPKLYMADMQRVGLHQGMGLALLRRFNNNGDNPTREFYCLEFLPALHENLKRGSNHMVLPIQCHHYTVKYEEDSNDAIITLLPLEETYKTHLFEAMRNRSLINNNSNGQIEETSTTDSKCAESQILDTKLGINKLLKHFDLCLPVHACRSIQEAVLFAQCRIFVIRKLCGLTRSLSKQELHSWAGKMGCMIPEVVKLHSETIATISRLLSNCQVQTTFFEALASAGSKIFSEALEDVGPALDLIFECAISAIRASPLNRPEDTRLIFLNVLGCSLYDRILSEIQSLIGDLWDPAIRLQAIDVLKTSANLVTHLGTHFEKLLSNLDLIKISPSQTLSYNYNYLNSDVQTHLNDLRNRSVRLERLLRTLHRWDQLTSFEHLPGTNQSIKRYLDLCDEFKMRFGSFKEIFDFLRFPDIEADAMEFEVHMNEIELELQRSLRCQFSLAVSTSHALDLLQQVSSLLPVDIKKQETTDMILNAFQSYTCDLDTFQVLYERRKAEPPTIRGGSMFVGAITWSRCLLRKVMEPMKQFQRYESLIASRRQCNMKAFKIYNRLAQTLLEFETLWYHSWIKNSENIVSSLGRPVLVMHPSTKLLHVNLDVSIITLHREALWLRHMNLKLPASIQKLSLAMGMIQENYHKLAHTVRTLNEAQTKAPQSFQTFSKCFHSAIATSAKPGLTLVSWTSSLLDGFIQSFSETVKAYVGAFDRAIEIHTNCVMKNTYLVGDSLTCTNVVSTSSSTRGFLDSYQQYFSRESERLKLKQKSIVCACNEVQKIFSHHLIDRLGIPSSQLQEEMDKYKLMSLHSFQMAVASTLIKCIEYLSFLVLREADSNISFHATKDCEFDTLCLFNANVILQSEQASIEPKLDNCRKSLVQTIRAIVRVPEKLQKSDTQLEDSSSNVQSFIGSEFIQYQFIDIYGHLRNSMEQALDNIQSSFDRLHDTVSRYLIELHEQASWISQIGTDPEYIITSDKDVYIMEERIDSLMKYQVEIDQIPERTQICGSMMLCMGQFKTSLQNKLDKAQVLLLEELNRYGMQRMKDSESSCSILAEKLIKPIENIKDFAEMIEILSEVRHAEAKLEMALVTIGDISEILTRHCTRDKCHKVLTMDALLERRKTLIKLTETASSNLEMLQREFMEHVREESSIMRSKAKSILESWESNGPDAPGLSPQDAANKITEFKPMIEEFVKRRYELYLGESLFGFGETEFEEINDIVSCIGDYEHLYSLFLTVMQTLDKAMVQSWESAKSNLKDLISQLQEYSVLATQLPKTMKEKGPYQVLKARLEEFIATITLLQGLAHPMVKDRHWEDLQLILGTDFQVSISNLSMKNLVDANLVPYYEEVEDICSRALKEAEVEKKLETVQKQWAEEILVFDDHKLFGPVLLKSSETAELMERLEDSMMLLGTLSSSRFSSPFRPQLQKLQGALGTVSDTLNSWLMVQSAWSYLEAVFDSGDLAKQLPTESQQFKEIHKKFMEYVTNARDKMNVVEACKSDQSNLSLRKLLEALEICQKGLASYLETKRSEFPRFYFVSDSTLLEILSLGSDPRAVVQHFQSGLFDSLANVSFESDTSTRIVSMWSKEGECVPLPRAIDANGPPEKWLNRLVYAMQQTIRMLIRKTAKEAIDPNLNILDFFLSRPAQIALVGLQMRWTNEMTAALNAAARGEKGALTRALRRTDATLKDLVDCALKDDLTRVQRIALETCITVCMHQKEVTEDLVAKRICSPRDFEWLRQCRVKWKVDKNTALVSICDVDLEYSYEYLGVKERLVITPLTDVCYVTLTQALGMFLGGAPAGPAGTGKTETTKDLGATLGKYVVVFNCSDQMDHKSMGKIFKGLAQSGLWGCFDEFNRINLDVLSVCAQQVSSVLTAMREHRKSFVFTDGTTVPLDPRVGFFITMNPGYAGRQELPENLKALFRGVTMMVPNRRIIMKVKLAAAGFQENDILSKKFDVLYSLCEQQLSKQPHYDFGLRNILSVLRTAGSAKRANPNVSESELIMRTLRDMNMSKFVAEDVPIFLSLVNDLFPGQNVEEAPSADVNSALHKVCAEKGLQPHPTWMRKCMQLYETTLVRHGIMAVGPTGTGKSTAVSILAEALTSIGQKTVVWKMNPKSITAEQMFGKLDATTGDWTEGIFAVLWRKAAKAPKSQNTWIVLDGPVDAVWIENLNTVLDDNKVLTLANGDRILMTPNMRLIFELDNLRNASPATVSRAGIIYFSESELGWKPLVDSWLQKRPLRESKLVRPFFDTLLGPALEYIRKHCHPAIENSDFCLVQTLLTLLNGVFGQNSLDDGIAKEPEEHNTSFDIQRRRSSVILQRNIIHAAVSKVSTEPRNKSTDTQNAIEIQFLYCIAWSIGGILDVDDRKTFDSFLRTISSNLPKIAQDSDDTIFEYHVQFEENGNAKWRHWSESIPQYNLPIDISAQFSEIIIPTIDIVRYGYLLSLVHAAGGSSLLTGATGTAKTTIISKFISDFESHSYQTKRITLTSLTTPSIYCTALEQCIGKRQGRIFGPPGGRKATIFIDDISMPALNEWGDQVTSELLRQILEDRFLYSTEKPIGDQKHLVDLHYVAAMNTPGLGKNDIPPRLKRQFCVFFVPAPSNQVIKQTFGKIIDSHFLRFDLSPKLSEVACSVVPAIIDVWRAAQASLLPSPSKVHYNFTLRDVSKIIQGIVLADVENSICRRLRKDMEATSSSSRITEIMENNANANPSENKHDLETDSHSAYDTRDENTKHLSEIRQDNDEDVSSESSIQVKNQLEPEKYIIQLCVHEMMRVFSDKLLTHSDKTWLRNTILKVTDRIFGFKAADQVENSLFEMRFASFLREPPIDDITGEIKGPRPSVYEAAPMGQIQLQIENILAETSSTTRLGRSSSNVVLFNDAVEHVLRISRVLSMARGSILLVGIGGSGKQSLAELAVQLTGATCFKMSNAKSYGVANLLEDLKGLYKHAALRPTPAAFIITEASIKSEVFLEYFNQVLQTGEVAGMFTPEEMDDIFCEIRPKMKKLEPGREDTPDNLYKFFIKRVQDRLHLIICLSPTGRHFTQLNQKFPGIINGCTIDWFLPWPKEALLSVASANLKSWEQIRDLEVHQASSIQEFMAAVHERVGEACKMYSERYKTNVHITPKSFLSAMQNFKTLYSKKKMHFKAITTSLDKGLRKIAEAKDAVSNMRQELTVKHDELAIASKDAEELLKEISESTKAAEVEKGKVSAIVENVRKKAEEIALGKASAEADLAAAQPALDAALEALNSITQKDIVSLKALRNPPDVIKRIFDCVLILRHNQMGPVKWQAIKGSNVVVANYSASIRMMSESSFLQSLLSFPKEAINDETVELLQPYFSAPDFNYESARKASGNVAGLCNWAESMCKYHEVAKFVEPKIVALQKAERELQEAEQKQEEAEAELAQVQKEVDDLQARLECATKNKKYLEEDAAKTKQKLENALTLMSALGGEEIRWAEQNSSLKNLASNLVGDCAVAASFLSYLGPFNKNLRDLLMGDILNLCEGMSIRMSSQFDLSGFLVDDTEIGQWTVEGLPSDPLSVQNGILVTRSPRCPLLLDPQAQGRSWIIRKEESKGLKITSFDDSCARNIIEDAITKGVPVLIENIEEDIDPIFDDILEQNFIQKGNQCFVQLEDKELEVCPGFRMYLSCRHPNPNFSPETFARVSMIDFRVTESGLEDQLLSELIFREKRDLEEQRRSLLEEVQNCKQRIASLESDLLTQLSNSSGNLVEDSALVEVLAATKETSNDVANRMKSASETRAKVTSICEEYRDAAHHAMLLYFVLSEFASVNPMYQVSLNQFMALYWRSIDESVKSDCAKKRVTAISDYLTNAVYQYAQRGIFEKHKILFSFMMANKINIDIGIVSQKELDIFLDLGPGTSPQKRKKKPKDWIPMTVWDKILVLSEELPSTFGKLPSDIGSKESLWKKFYESEEPEMFQLPGYSDDLSSFQFLCLIRAFREDRVLLECANYVAKTLGKQYIEPVHAILDHVYVDSKPECPIICILSPGADPTRNIEDLAKRKRVKCHGVSMGQGQEILARRLIDSAANEGHWVLLQNAHLGLKYLCELQDALATKSSQGLLSQDFRLWITSEPHEEFPIGLLQTSIKITNEAPSGIRAGLQASYQWLSQEIIDAVPKAEWRQILFSLCFMHAVAQERRKFGPLGWNVPYEFNNADLSAAIQFLQNHMLEISSQKGSLPNWSTVRYMISKIHYGGKITDEQDRAIMDAYASIYLNDNVLQAGYIIFEDVKDPRKCKYTIPNCIDIEEYREAINLLPESETPELFGLHKNADLTFRSLQVDQALTLIGSILMKEHSISSHFTEEIVQKIDNICSNLPSNVGGANVMKLLNKLPGGGLAPLNVFLRQEINRINAVISSVQDNLRMMRLAAIGSIPMTNDLSSNLRSIQSDKSPKPWIQLSWEAISLTSWLEGLLRRHEQLETCVTIGHPKSFWFPGFFNPQGFLSAIIQQISRNHAAENWALDDVCLVSEVTKFADPSAVRETSSNGAFIHGLFLEGASWSMREGKLIDSEPRKLFHPMPIIHISAVLHVDRRRKGVYEAPCYKVRHRTRANFIENLMLRTDQDRNKWILRGVALLCSIE